MTNRENMIHGGSGDGRAAPRVSVVLVNWNGWTDCVECIESLLESSYANFEILLVDNRSSDGSLGHICAWAERLGPEALRVEEYTSEEIEAAADGGPLAARPPPPGPQRGRVLSLVRSSKNGGFGAGNNLALKLLQQRGDAELVWLLNNDTVVTTGAMSEMVRRTLETGGLVGGALYFFHEPGRVQAFGGSYLNRRTGLIRTETRARPEAVDFVNGACLMFSADVLRTVGMFDERIFMYFEEVDYCLRARKHGFRCAVSDAVVLHKHGGASKKLDDSFAWSNVLLNKPYVLRKNYGYGMWHPIYVASVLLFASGVAASPGKRKAARKIVAGWCRKLIPTWGEPRC